MLAEVGVLFALVLCGFMLWLFLTALGDLRERVAFLEQSYSEVYRSLTVLTRMVQDGCSESDIRLDSHDCGVEALGASYRRDVSGKDGKERRTEEIDSGLGE